MYSNVKNTTMHRSICAHGRRMESTRVNRDVVRVNGEIHSRATNMQAYLLARGEQEECTERDVLQCKQNDNEGATMRACAA